MITHLKHYFRCSASEKGRYTNSVNVSVPVDLMVSDNSLYSTITAFTCLARAYSNAGSLTMMVARQLGETLSSKRLVTKGSVHPVGHVTMSIGAAQARPGEQPAALVERADAALYEAKRTGRNRVCTERIAGRRGYGAGLVPVCTTTAADW